MVSRFLLAVVFLSYTSGICEGILDPTTVQITNDLSPDTTLTVHCKSGNDDLGPRILQKGQSFTFKFKVNFFGTTQFFCNFRWSSNDKVISRWFDIFHYRNDAASGCTECNWKVHQNDVCRSVPERKAVYCFEWNHD